MPIQAHAGEHFTIRRKVFTLLSAKYHIYDQHGTLVGYCRQKSLRLREELRLYTDDSCTHELLTIKARNIIDFSGTYDVRLSGEPTPVATFTRRGLRSAFVQDSWSVVDSAGREIAVLEEQGGTLTVLRRWINLVAFFSPQTYLLSRLGGPPLASLRVHFNPFVYKMSIAILADDPDLDDVIILAGGCIIATIEGRQSNNG
ncbi:MAG: hypothetical protein KF859_12100 [Phycisphaeraceae bacterium]|nr:hypothetical protein [Phycisphaeraceae bacterium]